MYKLNTLQNPKANEFVLNENITLNPLKDNTAVLEFISSFAKSFGFSSLNTFNFSKEGILSILLKLEGKIAVSVGESEAIIDAAREYKKLGFEINFISLKKDGSLDYEALEKCDYIFCSSYIMDTYVKVDLQKVKELTQAKIISNESATLKNTCSDIVLLDSFKLTAYSVSSIILHNGEFEEQALAYTDTACIYLINEVIKNFDPKTSYKNDFKKLLIEELQEDIYFFVDSNSTLDYALHFGLKGIKAREIIRTLALSNIFVTNGEGCSLGLSKPSRIIQEMGYEEFESRWSLSLSFFDDLNEDNIQEIVKAISKKYRQIRALND